MITYTYITVLFFTVIICLIASFNPLIKFNKYFGVFIKSAICASIPFILWDVYFTHLGVWWFDTRYTLGITIAGLPIEEWLFFICIPFSCIFTYYCIDKFFNIRWLRGFNNMIVFFSIVTCSLIALLYSPKIYTLITTLATILTLIFLHFIARAYWISQASFVFTILMLGFFPVNGILTGFGLDHPIVNYNPKDYMGVRMGTIPIEDAIYGYTQFLWVLYFFKKFLSKKNLKMLKIEANE
ncbi:lycopene cyclase domain-containing protein [Apibacter muscae]|uniref:lycopene cyclase domain-containing protein n=1 Tax=Apibacter muscae TaxID=2509004 RepID=UPI0011AC42E0|nr:lycopene cyclase domain-containing protein [Apibacter muscae]TWP22577.1 lycopene cyclase domain-containing protein [Apibacter muscae]